MTLHYHTYYFTLKCFFNMILVAITNTSVEVTRLWSVKTILQILVLCQSAKIVLLELWHHTEVAVVSFKHGGFPRLWWHLVVGCSATECIGDGGAWESMLLPCDWL